MSKALSKTFILIKSLFADYNKTISFFKIFNINFIKNYSHLWFAISHLAHYQTQYYSFVETLGVIICINNAWMDHQIESFSNYHYSLNSILYLLSMQQVPVTEAFLNDLFKYFPAYLLPHGRK